MPDFSKVFQYSSLTETFTRNGNETVLYEAELQDFLRAGCGALFFAVPLHFTMEMWERARVMSGVDLIVVLLVAYLANVGYNIFSGYKGEEGRQAAWLDALSALGIGALASLITLLLVDQITPEISSVIIIKMIALEAVPTSFGASLARNQLGGGDPADKPHVEDQFSLNTRKLMGASLGALLFSFNIAPTMEPILIAASIGHYQLLFLVMFSLIVSYAMVFMGNFVQSEDDEGYLYGSKWGETVIAYVVSLLVSAALLWMFGYLSFETSWYTGLSRVVVLGYVTSLGTSAGRLIL